MSSLGLTNGIVSLRCLRDAGRSAANDDTERGSGRGRGEEKKADLIPSSFDLESHPKFPPEIPPTGGETCLFAIVVHGVKRRFFEDLEDEA